MINGMAESTRRSDENDTTSRLFREKYSAFRHYSLRERIVVVLGIHERTDEFLFHHLFEGEEEAMEYDYGTQLRLYLKVKTVQRNNEIIKIIRQSTEPGSDSYNVSTGAQPPSTPNLASFSFLVNNLYKDRISHLILVLDASRIRLTSIEREYMDEYERTFGPGVWKNTSIILLNADSLLRGRSMGDYLAYQDSVIQTELVEKVDRRILGLPSNSDQFSLETQRSELFQLIGPNQWPYSPSAMLKVWLSIENQGYMSTIWDYLPGWYQGAALPTE